MPEPKESAENSFAYAFFKFSSTCLFSAKNSSSSSSFYCCCADVPNLG